MTKDLRSRGILRDKAEAVSRLPQNVAPKNPSSTLPSLRHSSMFAKQFKQSSTRVAENGLLSETEVVRLRLTLLRKERERIEQSISQIERDKKNIVVEIEEKSSQQMQNYHELAKEKASFYEWVSQFKADTLAYDLWMTALKNQRLALMGDLHRIFPIGDLCGKRPTLRWITLPAADEVRECHKNEVMLSVCVCAIVKAILREL